MKKKILVGAGLGILAVVILLVLVVGFFLGDVIKAGMETVGPKVTQTSLTVESVHVSVLAGSAGVKGLVLGNPQGYQSANAISLDKAAVRIEPMSVLADKVIIHAVEVHNAEINFEGNPFGANNLKKILDNVNAFAGSGAGTGSRESSQTGARKPAKKLQVDSILIAGAKVHFKGATLPLPDIHLANFGQGPEGITPAALIKDVLGEVTTATTAAAIKSAGSAATDAGKALGSEASKIGKTLGGLFKK
jgi:uncharacterized protein involved in outer membrane biogenesis